MVKKITLIVEDRALELVIVNDVEWCTVYFKHEEVHELGSDVLNIVAQRFLSILEPHEEHKVTHIIDGESYTCFIMLAEKHASGYMRRNQRGILLHFRDSEGKAIDDIQLSEEDCINWKKLLLNFIADHTLAR